MPKSPSEDGKKISLVRQHFALLTEISLWNRRFKLSLRGYDEKLSKGRGDFDQP